jgi:hypothetical protein
MKLMDIDSNALSIPDTDYDVRVTILATKFAHIVTQNGVDEIYSCSGS